MATLKKAHHDDRRLLAHPIPCGVVGVGSELARVDPEVGGRSDLRDGRALQGHDGLSHFLRVHIKLGKMVNLA